MDVLRSLVPYLLVGRIACVRMPESYSWALPAHAKRDRQIPCNAFLLHVFEKAWVPTLRIKLVCKALYRVVNEHMENLLQPREVCIHAAAKILDAYEQLPRDLKAIAKKRSANIHYEYQRRYEGLVPDLTHEEECALAAYEYRQWRGW